MRSPSSWCLSFWPCRFLSNASSSATKIDAPLSSASIDNSAAQLSSLCEEEKRAESVLKWPSEGFDWLSVMMNSSSSSSAQVCTEENDGDVDTNRYFVNLNDSRVSTLCPLPSSCTLMPSDLLLPVHISQRRLASGRLALIGLKADFWSVEPSFYDSYYADSLTATPVTLVSLQYSLPHVLFCLETYPSDLWPKINVERIVFAEELLFQNVSRDAIPSPYSKTLYIACRRHERVFFISILHHEIFHLLDFAIHRRSMKNRPKNSSSRKRAVLHFCDFADDGWCKLNERSFVYGTSDGRVGGQEKDYRVNSMAMSGKAFNCAIPRGLVSRYAASDKAEDKAEVWSYMLRTFSHVTSHRQDSDFDEVICRKMMMLKNRARLFCANLNNEWWQRVAKTRNFSIVRNRENWQELLDKQGLTFWHNSLTQQTVAIL